MAATKDGSPPRAWGRHQVAVILLVRQRFTPTCVGTTIDTTHLRTSTAVHPHVRGDDDDGWPWNWLMYGSPPRAWGRPDRS